LIQCRSRASALVPLPGALRRRARPSDMREFVNLLLRVRVGTDTLCTPSWTNGVPKVVRCPRASPTTTQSLPPRRPTRSVAPSRQTTFYAVDSIKTPALDNLLVFLQSVETQEASSVFRDKGLPLLRRILTDALDGPRVADSEDRVAEESRADAPCSL
jgi:hypothetical protein